MVRSRIRIFVAERFVRSTDDLSKHRTFDETLSLLHTLSTLNAPIRVTNWLPSEGTFLDALTWA